MPCVAAPNYPMQAGQQVSAEELRRREDWRVNIGQVVLPKNGCFTAAYPNNQWREVACVAAPDYPMPPRRGPRPLTVGNGDDVSPQAPSGNISTAIGSFDNLTNVTSESGQVNNTGPAVNNAYTLQLNTNFFASSTCSGAAVPANCLGWEQFVFENNAVSHRIFIQVLAHQLQQGMPGRLDIVRDYRRQRLLPEQRRRRHVYRCPASHQPRHAEPQRQCHRDNRPGDAVERDAGVGAKRRQLGGRVSRMADCGVQRRRRRGRRPGQLQQRCVADGAHAHHLRRQAGADLHGAGIHGRDQQPQLRDAGADGVAARPGPAVRGEQRRRRGVELRGRGDDRRHAPADVQRTVLRLPGVGRFLAGAARPRFCRADAPSVGKTDVARRLGQQRGRDADGKDRRRNLPAWAGDRRRDRARSRRTQRRLAGRRRHRHADRERVLDRERGRRLGEGHGARDVDRRVGRPRPLARHRHRAARERERQRQPDCDARRRGADESVSLKRSLRPLCGQLARTRRTSRC